MMFNNFSKILILLVLLSVELYGQDGRLIPNPVRNIPRWVRNEFTAKNMDRDYAITYKLYPYTFRGDFNGDERRDVVIQVTEKKTGKPGVAIFHAKKPQAIYTNVSILGAGKDLNGAGDDLQWVNSWNMIAQHKFPSSGYKGLTEVRGDILLLEKRGGKKGLVYWDGKKYSWHRLKE